jgi:hypothetical protein
LAWPSLWIAWFARRGQNGIFPGTLSVK